MPFFFLLPVSAGRGMTIPEVKSKAGKRSSGSSKSCRPFPQGRRTPVNHWRKLADGLLFRWFDQLIGRKLTQFVQILYSERINP
jgi:hypothetical protein